MGQNNKSQSWCPFPDCEKCPHSDCIKDRIFRPIQKEGPRSAEQAAEKAEPRPPSKYSLLPEEEKQRRRQMARQWQKDNRDRYLATRRRYEQRNRVEINAKKRMRELKKVREEVLRSHGEQHLSDGAEGQRLDTGAGS